MSELKQRVEIGTRPTIADVGNFEPTIRNLYYILETEYITKCREQGPSNAFAVSTSTVKATYDALRYRRLHDHKSISDAEQLFFVALALADSADQRFEQALRVQRESLRPIVMEKL